MAYETLKHATDKCGHPITQADWDRAIKLIESWFSSTVTSAQIVKEAHAILDANNG